MIWYKNLLNSFAHFVKTTYSKCDQLVLPLCLCHLQLCHVFSFGFQLLKHCDIELNAVILLSTLQYALHINVQ